MTTTTIKRSSRFNANYNRRKRLKAATQNIFRNAKRFGWQSSAINRVLADLYSKDDWKRLPANWRNELHGYIDGHRDNIETMHLHLCNDGKYRKQGEYTYDPLLQHSPMKDDSCVIVWAHMPDHVYYAGDDHLTLCRTCHISFQLDEWEHIIGYPS